MNENILSTNFFWVFTPRLNKKLIKNFIFFKILQTDEERMDILNTFNKITIRDFQKIFRSINWVC